jgi:CheY-like chemotaxis protein/anti-sigma regulatory factor (Ser/Thr protein kinase)
LRTPLNGILGFAQLLAHDRADNLRADQSERINVIRSSGGMLLHLINEVLEISSLEAGQLAVDVHSVLLRPCLESAWRSVVLQAEAAGVSLQPLACPAELRVMGNEQRLVQVLGNLLTNAIKYNRRGGSVSVDVEIDPDMVRIAVTDTGWGMTEEQRAHLFQPFNRLGAERSDVAGTGLGLVITQNLLQLMGGRIEVRSEVGRGATFTACLPLCATSLAAANAAHDAPRHTELTAVAQTPLSARGVVLYVEDNEVNAVLMQAIAGMRPGIQLHVAIDGASALLSAPSLRPDLMLIDLDLPDIDGQSLLTQLRGCPALQAVPAVMVSATPPANNRGSLTDAGFIDHWLKPLDIDRVLLALDRLLGRAE